MKFAGFAALAIAALSTTALAQQASRATDQAKPITRAELSDELNADYADLDSNKDGKVTAEEIKGRLMRKAEADLSVLKKARDEAFAKLDTNKDGTISRAEFDEKAPLPAVKGADEKVAANLSRFDADKDGNITQAEFRAPTLANFDKLDGNKDGTLSVAEQKAQVAAAKKAPAVKKTPSLGR